MSETLRPPSRTAVLTAVARALYRLQPPPLVLDDHLAFGLAGEEGAAIAERLQKELPMSDVLAFCRWVCVRARFTDDLVEMALSNGVRQYVILGAGLDSFAYRRRDLLSALRVFEVDHPASQAWKRRRLGELGVDSPAELVFAPVDFERQALEDGLRDAGFDFDRRAVFSWIGVTMYLTPDAIDAALATIARCRAGTQVALTYNQPLNALDALAARVTSAFAGIAAEMGEPFVSLFLPGAIDDLLRRHGFDHIVHFGPREALTSYFDGRTDVEIAGAQRLVAASVR